MIAIGIGCRRNCPADDIVALVRRALALLPAAAKPDGLFSLAEKKGEPGLRDAARTLGLPLTFLSAAILRDAEACALTRSARIEAMFGVPSVAETAALAGAGRGARLLVSRQASATATCAVAQAGCPS